MQQYESRLLDRLKLFIKSSIVCELLTRYQAPIPLVSCIKKPICQIVKSQQVGEQLKLKLVKNFIKRVPIFSL